MATQSAVDPKQSSSSEDENAAKPLTAVLPRWLVAVLGVVTLALVTLVLHDAQNKWNADPGASRYLLCLSVSFYLPIFMFILYPNKVTLTKLPWVDIPVQLTGPVALWALVLGILLKTFPEPAAGYWFGVVNKTNTNVFVDRNLKWNPAVKPAQIYWSGQEPTNPSLSGVYIEFFKDQPSCTGEISYDSNTFSPVTFNRSGPYVISLVKPKQATGGSHP